MSDRKNVKVRIGQITLQHFQLNEFLKDLNIVGYMEIQWDDQRLSWDQSQWKLEKLQIHSANHVWIPVLSSQSYETSLRNDDVMEVRPFFPPNKMSRNSDETGESKHEGTNKCEPYDSQFVSWLTHITTCERPAADIRTISGSVVSSAGEPVGKVMSKPRPPAWMERSYRLDPTVPSTWDAHEVQSGTFIAYEFPHPIQDVVDDVPLDRCCPEIARIQMAADSFAKGGERLAYYGRDLETREDIVLKEYIRVYSDEGEAHRHDSANQLQAVASYFAALFMADCEEEMLPEKIPASLDFLKVKALALGTSAAPRYMNCEPRLDPAATFVRFTNNRSHVMSEENAQSEGVSVEVLRFVVAFSHYTYTASLSLIQFPLIRSACRSVAASWWSSICRERSGQTRRAAVARSSS
ncbi:Efk-1 [Aphelenchoides fujianensis]|nr:Efk-1 [Aphelenchoides fujianensis]